MTRWSKCRYEIWMAMLRKGRVAYTYEFQVGNRGFLVVLQHFFQSSNISTNWHNTQPSFDFLWNPQDDKEPITECHVINIPSTTSEDWSIEWLMHANLSRDRHFSNAYIHTIHTYIPFFKIHMVMIYETRTASPLARIEPGFSCWTKVIWSSKLDR